MDFFLYEVVARVVALYLAIDTYRTIQRGLVEGKIKSFNPDWLDWITYVNNRKTNPVMFWIEICIQTSILVACSVVAVFGWLRP
jgi:hypothetical protein